jgi:Trypsin-like serine proteases, typically periplasmic, contain C-terminal PDZ domain
MPRCGNGLGCGYRRHQSRCNRIAAVTIGDSSRVEVGDVALAIGNPFALGQTVTMGIVSALGRTGLGIERYENFIQTDAAVNPGNSGGALVNTRGELIGINTAILSESGGNQGIGFAIPSNMARSLMNQIKDHGKVTRGYIGIVPQDLTPQLASSFGIKDTRGALVSFVEDNSPAANAECSEGTSFVKRMAQRSTTRENSETRLRSWNRATRFL